MEHLKVHEPGYRHTCQVIILKLLALTEALYITMHQSLSRKPLFAFSLSLATVSQQSYFYSIYTTHPAPVTLANAVSLQLITT